jgi:hypothetical protein
MTDVEFISQFRACEMEESHFNHEAHIRLAWLIIDAVGIERALVDIPVLIRAYVDHLRVRNIYNHTLTIAAVQVIYHFMNKSNSGTFPAFIEEFPNLLDDFRSLIESHYSSEIYTSERAKSEFVAPNLLPFDL